MGTFKIFVVITAVLVLLVKSYTSRDLLKARERYAEGETENKRIRGQVKIIQFERAPLTKQLGDLEKTLSSQNQKILALQTQLGQINDENTNLKRRPERNRHEAHPAPLVELPTLQFDPSC